MDEHVFDAILDENEKIIKVIKPNKKRYFFVNLIISLLLIFLIGFGLVVGGIISYILLGYDDLQILLPMTITGGFFIILLIIYIVYLILVFNHTYYALSNRRIMIRTGMIGVKYQSMDLKYVTCGDVHIGVLDLMIKAHTGSIYFATSSSPFTLNNRNFKVSHFVWHSIDDPINVYKEVKEFIYNEQNKA